MSKKEKVVSPKDLPIRFPIWQTVVLVLICKVYMIPAWAKGVVWTLFALLWLGAIVQSFREEPTRLFGDEK